MSNKTENWQFQLEKLKLEMEEKRKIRENENEIRLREMKMKHEKELAQIGSSKAVPITPPKGLKVFAELSLHYATAEEGHHGPS